MSQIAAFSFLPKIPCTKTGCQLSRNYSSFNYQEKLHCTVLYAALDNMDVAGSLYLNYVYVSLF